MSICDRFQDKVAVFCLVILSLSKRKDITPTSIASYTAFLLLVNNHVVVYVYVCAHIMYILYELIFIDQRLHLNESHKPLE